MLDQEDHARGARVEIALAAAARGDLAVTAGIIAGMSGEERAEFGPLIVAAVPRKPGIRLDPFGTLTVERIDRGDADDLDVPAWVNG